MVEIQSPPVIACCPYASACPTSPSYSAISDAAVAAMADASGHSSLLRQPQPRLRAVGGLAAHAAEQQHGDRLG